MSKGREIANFYSDHNAGLGRTWIQATGGGRKIKALQQHRRDRIGGVRKRGGNLPEKLEGDRPS